MNADCQNARRKRSKAERARKRHGTEASKIAYAIAYRHGEAVINTTKNAYYKNKRQQKDERLPKISDDFHLIIYDHNCHNHF